MKKITLSVLILFCVFFLNPASAQTLDEILNKHFKAVGQEKLVAAESFIIKAKLSQMGMEFPMEMKIKKPNKFRVEMELQGQKMIQAYDGNKGWMIAPMLSPEPQELAGDQLKQAMSQTDMEGELYEYKKKGSSAEFIGKVNVEGGVAYRIKLVDKDKNSKYYFIDAKTYLVKKIKAKIEAMGQTVDIETRMKDYREIDGIKMAMKVESDSPMGTAVITMEEVKINSEINDVIFKLPVK
jgi:outer membrane lipoprotein-sorting protein